MSAVTQWWDGPSAVPQGAATLTPRMRNFKETNKALRELLGQRVLVLDGAMGTMLQQCDLTARDFGGASLEGCNEVLVRTRLKSARDSVVHFGYELVRLSDGTLLAEGETTHIVTDPQMKIAVLPDKYLNAFRAALRE